LRGKILFYFLLVLVLLYLPRTLSEPERTFLVVIDAKGNAVTSHVELSLQGLAAYRLNATHSYASLSSKRTVRFAVRSWGSSSLYRGGRG